MNVTVVSQPCHDFHRRVTAATCRDRDDEPLSHKGRGMHELIVRVTDSDRARGTFGIARDMFAGHVRIHGTCSDSVRDNNRPCDRARGTHKTPSDSMPSESSCRDRRRVAVMLLPRSYRRNGFTMISDDVVIDSHQ
jgi:hypothetical protein